MRTEDQKEEMLNNLGYYKDCLPEVSKDGTKKYHKMIDVSVVIIKNESSNKISPEDDVTIEDFNEAGMAGINIQEWLTEDINEETINAQFINEEEFNDIDGWYKDEEA